MDAGYYSEQAILVITKGHPFERDAFFAMLEELPGRRYAWTHAEHPAAASLLRPESARHFAAILFYDLPGIHFRVPGKSEAYPPPPGYIENLEALTAAGKPLIFLHHAIAGWPTSERYAEIIGGRFFYLPGRLRGVEMPDSGYRHDVRHHAYPVAEHPITAGLEDGFDIEDEIYLYEVLEDSVLPLMRSSASFVQEAFHSTRLALEGRMFDNAGWQHPPGSNLIAWARREQASPIVYIQCGHGPTAYANPGFQRLLGNAADWAVSREAADWAAGG